MENKTTLHEKKLYSLFGGAAALLGLILPWATVSYGGFGGGASQNGFAGFGFLSLLGIVGVVVSSLMGDKLKDYDKNMKLVAICSFAAIALGAFIGMMQISSGNRGFGGVKTGIGIFLTILAGGAGILWVTDIIKLPKKPGSHSK
ncbi:MAG: hypothetical protein U0U70_12500 [Chitinophagaceae bacterium]